MVEQSGKQEAIKRLQSLVNIGPRTAERLYSIGVETPEKVKRSDPEEIFQRLREKEGGRLDRCVLYLLRGAVLDLPWPMCQDKFEGRGVVRSGKVKAQRGATRELAGQTVQERMQQ